jgi:hypothetical protein
MRRNDVAVIVVTAIVAMAATVAAHVSMSGAFADGERPQPGGAAPVLQVGGVVLSLAPEKAVYAAGEKPVVLLTAANTEGVSAEVTVDIRMTSETLASRMSRVALPARPSMNWSHVQVVSLLPNETKTVRIEAGAALAAGSAASFSMTCGGKTVLGATVSAVAVGAGGENQTTRTARQQAR